MINVTRPLEIPTSLGLPDGRYAIYEDFDDKNLIRIIRNTPRVRRDEKDHPVFQFVRFRSAGKEDLQGGYLVINTDVHIPQADMEKIAAHHNKRVVPVDVVDATASLEIFKDDKSFVTALPALTKPGLVGDLVAAFGSRLTPEGATIVDKTMRGGGIGQVTLRHTITTWVRTPGVNMRVFLNAAKDVKYVQTLVEQRRSGAWGEQRTDVYQTRRELTERQVAGVTADFPATMTKEDKDALRDWGWKTLDAMIDDYLRRGGDITSLQLERTFTESLTFPQEFPLQGAIERLPESEYKDLNLYRDVDLDDPFFRKLGLGISTSANFSLPVRQVTVDLEYGGLRWSIPFTKETNVRKRLTDALGKENDPFVIVENGVEQRKYKYSYRVLYDNDRSYQSPQLEDDRVELNVPEGDPPAQNKPAQSRIFQVRVRGDRIDWAGMKKVLVDVMLGDRTFSTEVSDKAPADLIVEAFGDELAPPYRYKYTLTYVPKEGSQVKREFAETSSRELTIPEIFTTVADVRVMLADDTVDAADVNVTWTEDGSNGFKVVTRPALKLTKDKPEATWTVHRLSDNGTLSYAGVLTRGTKRTPLKDGDPAVFVS